MKKNRLSITLMTALLSVTALAGCNNDVKFSKEGVLVSYNKKGENPTQITADQIFVELNRDSSKYEQIYQAIRSIVIRNYFTINDEVVLEGQKDASGNPVKKNLGKDELAELQDKAQTAVNRLIYEAETASNVNKTTFKKEFDAICEREGVDDKDALYEKYLNQYKEDRFDDNMKKYHMSEIKNGSDVAELNDMWSGYYKDMAPYHVSHILVKLDDASGTNYADGKISKEDCEQLYNVVNRLIKGNEKFQVLAGDKNINEDDGSAEEHGALGIMNYKTGFINEFKLGIYAYEQLYGKNAAVSTNTNQIKKIQMPTSKKQDVDYKDAIKKSYGLTDLDTEIPTVDVSVFEDLALAKEKTKSPSKESIGGKDFDKQVMDGVETVLPRNIIYNELLNRHTFAFVEGPLATITDTCAEGMSGLYAYTEGKLAGRTLLSVKVAGEMRPVIMARGGSDSYQGIHFIVIGRDPFTSAVAGVTQDEYYTTLKPTDAGFPRNADGTRKTTYVNFASQELDDHEYETKAGALATTLQDYDTSKLDKYFIKKFMKKEGVELKDKQLAYELDEWIKNSNEKAVKDEQESWEKTWTDYVNALGKQNKERENLVSRACRIGFDKDIKTVITIGDVETLFTTYGELVKTAKANVQQANLNLIKVSNLAEPVQADIDLAKSKLETAKGKVEDLETAIGDTFVGYCMLQGMTKDEVKEVLENKVLVGKTTVTIENIYNEKGALCNDGTDHTK